MAVNVTVSGVELHDAKLEGATESAMFTVLSWVTRMTFVVLGLHVNESMALPWPAVAANVMVSGFVAHVDLGAPVWTNPTAM